MVGGAEGEEAEGRGLAASARLSSAPRAHASALAFVPPRRACAPEPRATPSRPRKMGALGPRPPAPPPPPLLLLLLALGKPGPRLSPRPRWAGACRLAPGPARLPSISEPLAPRFWSRAPPASLGSAPSRPLWLSAEPVLGAAG